MNFWKSVKLGWPDPKYPENRPQIHNRPLNREWNQPTNPRTALQIHVTGSANSRLLLGNTQTILQFFQNWANAGGSKVGKWLMWRRKKWHHDQGASRHICLSSWELHWRTSSSLFGKTQAHHHQYHNILKWWWFLRCIWWWSSLQPWSQWWWLRSTLEIMFDHHHQMLVARLPGWFFSAARMWLLACLLFPKWVSPFASSLQNYHHHDHYHY